jgi:hypothetical protein
MNDSIFTPRPDEGETDESYTKSDTVPKVAFRRKVMD